MALSGNEILFVTPIAPNGQEAPVTIQITTQQIANLSSGGGSGSGISSQNIITSGSTASTAALNSFNGWNSATAANKTQPIPTATGSLGQIIIADIYGNAGTYPISVSGATVKGVSQVYTNGGSITLVDTSQGWISI